MNPMFDRVLFILVLQWINNCVGEHNLRYFTGFVVFTPLCLCFYVHGAYLCWWTIIFHCSFSCISLSIDYRYHCNLFAAENITDIVYILFHCSPAILLFTWMALLYIMWITALCLTILFQVCSIFYLTMFVRIVCSM
jgi:hypothetical protein